MDQADRINHLVKRAFGNTAHVDLDRFQHESCGSPPSPESSGAIVCLSAHGVLRLIGDTRPEDWPVYNHLLSCFFRLIGEDKGFPICGDLFKLALESNFSPECFRLYDPESLHRTDRLPYPSLQKPDLDLILLPCLTDMRGLSPEDAQVEIYNERSFQAFEAMALITYLYTHHDALGETCLWLDAVGLEISSGPEENFMFWELPFIDRRGPDFIRLDGICSESSGGPFHIAPYIPVPWNPGRTHTPD